MSKSQPRNVAASVRQRLLNRSRTAGESFQTLLTRYALERFLYRMSQSEHRDRFVLKGAMLFQLWGGEPHRTTRDLDLLGFGSSAIGDVEQAVREICAVVVEEDGVVFQAETARGEFIKEDQEYEGVRIKVEARLESAKIRLQIDVGFGDAITPAPSEVRFPTLLELPAPVLRAYPRETVVAEKLQAIVHLGITTSRMKDFYDLWVLSQRFPFEGPVLAEAIRATFERRRTAVFSTTPVAFTAEFTSSPIKQAQWEAFVRRGELRAGGMKLEEVVSELHGFLMPVATTVADGEPFDKAWKPPGPWKPFAE